MLPEARKQCGNRALWGRAKRLRDERIAQLEAKNTRRIELMDNDSDESLKDHLAAVNKDLAIARERLVHYEAPCARQN